MRKYIEADRKKQKINNSLMILLIASAVIAIAGKIVSVDILSSLSFSMSFVLLMLLMCFLPSTYRWESMDLISVFVCIFFALFTILRNSQVNISFEYMKKWIIFVCTVLMLRVSATTVLSSQSIKTILGLGVAAGIMLVASYFVFGNRTTYARGITLGFSNPNEVAMFLLHGILYSLLLFAVEKKWYGKVICICLIAALLYLIRLTLSRSALISLLIMGVMLTVVCLGGEKILSKKWFCFVITVLPMAVVLLYRQFLESDWARYFLFMVSEGKGLDSRMLTWGPALEIIETNLLLGDYYSISKGIGIGVSQMHNTGLDVLASYGIIVFAAYHYMLYKSINRVAQLCQSKIQYVSLCAFYCVMIQGIFEAAFVSGALGIYLLSCGFLLIAGNLTCGRGWDKNRETGGKSL